MTKKNKKQQEARLASAKANLEKMRETFSPYVRPRQVIDRSTAGQWTETTRSNKMPEISLVTKSTHLKS
jgi:hypothetical protein